MLEEGLRKTTFPPGDAALAMLSFIRYELPEGGASAEERFLRIFSLMSDRLFGPISGEKDQFRHEIGGWFSFQNRWDRPSSSIRPSKNGSNSTHRGAELNSIDFDPVVQLLCGIEALVDHDKLPTLIEAISAETEYRPRVHFHFPFQALPRPTQDLIMAIIQSSIDGKPLDCSGRINGERLFQLLVRVPPKEQHELRRYQAAKTQQKQERNKPLIMSPVSKVASPFQNITNSASPQKKADELKNPRIMLTMLEVYLFTFIRYALASPKPTTPQPQGLGSSRLAPAKSIAYGEQVYRHLFQSYLLHFLPQEVRKDFIGFAPLSRDSELFLRIVIEFWFCGGMTFSPVTKAATSHRERKGMEVTIDLSTIFDLIKVNYEPPLSSIQASIRFLIIHVLKNSDIPLAVKDCTDAAAKSSALSDNASAPCVLPWCVSPAMTILQQPFYNYITSTFRYAPIHVVASPFFNALDTWLMWLEPWNVELRRRGTAGLSEFSPTKARKILASTVANMSPSNHKMEYTPIIVLPKPHSSSRFTKEWEPYIAANLHFYTAPLAIFLRRARELDFSQREFVRSFRLVQRVFRVYSPEIVDSINTLLAEGGAHTLSNLVAMHNKHLGDFSPANVGQLTLSSLANDTHNLLEEVYSQYMKKVYERDFFDRMEARIESLFGFVQTTSSDERNIQMLVEKARIIANLPGDYEIIPDPIARSLNRGSCSAGEQLERDQYGLLTERGRMQLLSGEASCSPGDVVYLGDAMRSRPTSYEIAMVVPLTIHASDWLNTLFGLIDTKRIRLAAKSRNDPDDSVLNDLLREDAAIRKNWFRLNLRFLADYRNIIPIFLLLWFILGTKGF